MKTPGYYLPLVLTLATIVLIVTGSIISFVYGNFRLVKEQNRSTSALNIAEAGINYYLWHLSKNNQDYCAGQPCVGPGPFGPFVREFRDASGAVVGNYSLIITPPVTDGGPVTVRSEGITITGERRTVEAQLGIPSFARFAFVSDSEVWFGDTEKTHGPVHSNRGVHFDGTSTDVVTSAVASYIPSACFGGDGTVKDGVWGSGGPRSLWQFPVPRIDFSAITANLQELQTAATANGLFLPTLVDNRGNRTHSGYVLELRANGIRVGRVTGRQDSGGSASGCAAHGRFTSRIQSIAWEASVRPLPANGIVFAAENLWVWGTVGSRLTIASGRLPENPSRFTNVFLQNDINYTTKDGSVALGLISQSDIVVNQDSENDLNIDAFLLSQRGRVFRPLYWNNVRDRITIYGGIASNSWWTWSWVSGTSIVSGYRTTVQHYDSNLTLEPPPLFPKTGSFSILNWREEPIL